MERKSSLHVEGVILEQLTNATFRVELPNGHRVLGFTPEKMRENGESFLPGSKVLLQMSPYDLSRGRITLPPNVENQFDRTGAHDVSSAIFCPLKSHQIFP